LYIAFQQHDNKEKVITETITAACYYFNITRLIYIRIKSDNFSMWGKLRAWQWDLVFSEVTFIKQFMQVTVLDPHTYIDGQQDTYLYENNLTLGLIWDLCKKHCM